MMAQALAMVRVQLRVQLVRLVQLVVSARLPATLRAVMPGLTVCVLIAAATLVASAVLGRAGRHLSAQTLALLIGLAVAAALRGRSSSFDPGVNFARKTLLRAGIALYGLQLSVDSLTAGGLSVLAADVLMVVTTFGLAQWMARRWLGLDAELATLIGAGAAVCGTSAVLATQQVIGAKAEHTTVALATVVLGGLVFLLLYPVLWQLYAMAASASTPADRSLFGVYIGSTVADVAQVIAIARAVSPETADSALVAKLARISLLAPFLAYLVFQQVRQTNPAVLQAPGGHPDVWRVIRAVPLFPVAFVGFALLGSVVPLSSQSKSAVWDISVAMLATALAAVGMATDLRGFRAVGTKPALLALGLLAWLAIGGAFINLFVHRVF